VKTIWASKSFVTIKVLFSKGRQKSLCNIDTSNAPLISAKTGEGLDVLEERVMS